MTVISPTAESTVLVCEPGWEHALTAELQQERPHWTARVIAPGWLLTEPAAEPPNEAPVATLALALASQTLPAATRVAAESVSAWGRTVGQQLIHALADHEGPWRLHVFRGLAAPTAPRGRSRTADPARQAARPLVAAGRVRLIEQAIIDHLKQKQRRLLRTRVLADSDPWQPHEALAQIGLIDGQQGFVSVCSPTRRTAWQRAMSRFPAGVVTVGEDRLAPSRAFQKIAETEVRLARPIAAGERCVDLGSSPGGWAYWALKRGARVVAVDRSPLRDDLMRDPGLTFVRGDAFEYLPTAPVDWLLCDVIAFPERIEQLLADWLGRRLCRHFCVTVKFRGQDEYGRIAAIKQTLAASGADWRLRRLTCNKNEITAYGGWATPVEPG